MAKVEQELSVPVSKLLTEIEANTDEAHYRYAQLVDAIIEGDEYEASRQFILLEMYVSRIRTLRWQVSIPFSPISAGVEYPKDYRKGALVDAIRDEGDHPISFNRIHHALIDYVTSDDTPMSLPSLNSVLQLKEDPETTHA